MSLLLGDCLELMREVPSGSVDMILADPPYGTTRNKWDSVIPFAPLWEQYWRICKPNAAVVLTAAQPFTSALVMSQVERFRYEWIWEKSAPTGFLNVNRAPLRAHESVLVFSTEPPAYMPQKTSGHPRKTVRRQGAASSNYGAQTASGYSSTDRFPRSVQYFATDPKGANIHPTQKPVALFEYLIKTYTNPGDLILDNTAGSGTTAIAAINTGRRWLCMERDPTIWAIAQCRIWDHLARQEVGG